MNTDRFLTRVWDKQEKKMTYVGDIFPSECLSDFISAYYNSFRFVGIEETGLTIIAHEKEAPHGMQIFSIPFGDRFVPMMCTGLRDKNKKLLYSGDILKYMDVINSNASFVTCGELYFDPENLCFDCDCNLKRLNEIECIGNRWENPELLEANE